MQSLGEKFCGVDRCMLYAFTNALLAVMTSNYASLRLRSSLGEEFCGVDRYNLQIYAVLEWQRVSRNHAAAENCDGSQGQKAYTRLPRTRYHAESATEIVRASRSGYVAAVFCSWP